MSRRALSIAFTASWLTLGAWSPLERAGAFLSGLFAPLAAGGDIDPNGRPVPPPQNFGGTIDPNGRPVPPPQKAGSTIDPDGRPAPPLGEAGSDIDPKADSNPSPLEAGGGPYGQFQPIGAGQSPKPSRADRPVNTSLLKGRAGLPLEGGPEAVSKEEVRPCLAVSFPSLSPPSG